MFFVHLIRCVATVTSFERTVYVPVTYLYTDFFTSDKKYELKLSGSLSLKATQLVVFA